VPDTDGWPPCAKIGNRAVLPIVGDVVTFIAQLHLAGMYSDAQSMAPNWARWISTAQATASLAG